MAKVNIDFPGNLAQVTTASDLRGVPSYMVDEGALYVVIDLGKAYTFDASSTAADDGVTVIKPADRTPLQAGRWIYQIEGFAPGPTGPAFATYTTLAGFKAAPISNKTQVLQAAGIPFGQFNWETDNAPYTADNINIIKADSASLSAGAWVRATAANGDPAALVNGGAIDVLFEQDIAGAQVPPLRAVVQAYDDAVIGANDIMPNPTLTGSPATGWTLTNATSANPGATHTAGTAASIKRTVAVEANTSYRVALTIDTTTAGGVSLDFDGTGIIGNVDYFRLPVGAGFQLILPYLSGAAASVEFAFRSDTVWAGKLTGFSVIKLSREAPFSHVALSSDNKSFARPVGLKVARNLSGMVGLGDRATGGMMTSSAAWCTDIGIRTGTVATNQIENTRIGALAGEYDRGSYGAFGGYSTARLNQGNYNTAWGFKPLGHNTTGTRNSAFAAFALFQNALGNDNTATGYQSLLNSEGSSNTGAGSNSGAQLGVGDGNTVVGANTGPYTADSNIKFNQSFGTMVGAGAQGYGVNVIAVGFDARVGSDPNTGGAAIATSALAIGVSSRSNANDTIVIGANAVVTVTTSIGSTIVGNGAQGLGEQSTGFGYLTEARMFSVALGSQAGRSSTGVRNTFVGVSAGNETGSPKNYDDVIVLGFDAHATKSAQAVLGSTAITETVLRGVIRANTTYTVAGLPSASTMGAGARSFVTDSNTTTFAAAVAGGGANGVPVYSDGTAWRVG